MNLQTPLPEKCCGRQPIRISRVPNGKAWTLHIAATRAATTWTHYIDKRTVPCDGSLFNCPACSRGLSRRFEAYLAAELLPRAERVVVAIPAAAWEKIVLLAGALVDGGLWGCRLDLSRPEGDIRLPVRVGDFRTWQPGEPRPRGIDTPAILRRAWDLPAAPIVVS